MDLCIMLVTGKVTYLYGACSTQVNNLSDDTGFIYGYADASRTRTKRINLKHVVYVEEME